MILVFAKDRILCFYLQYLFLLLFIFFQSISFTQSCKQNSLNPNFFLSFFLSVKMEFVLCLIPPFPSPRIWLYSTYGGISRFKCYEINIYSTKISFVILRVFTLLFPLLHLFNPSEKSFLEV